MRREGGGITTAYMVSIGKAQSAKKGQLHGMSSYTGLVLG